MRALVSFVRNIIIKTIHLLVNKTVRIAALNSHEKKKNHIFQVNSYLAHGIGQKSFWNEVGKNLYEN